MMRNSTMIGLSAPLALASTDSAKLPSQFTGVAYSGGVAPGHGVVIDVSTTQVPASMALLSEHDRRGIVGPLDNAAVSNNQIIVKGKLFSDMPGTQAERIAQQAQRGFLRWRGFSCAPARPFLFLLAANTGAGSPSARIDTGMPKLAYSP